MKSIQTRLNSGLGISLLLVFVVLGMAMSFSFRTLAENYILTRLEHDAENLLVALVLRSPEEPVGLRIERVNPIYQQAFSGHYYRVQVGDAVLRSRSLWDQDLHIPDVPTGNIESLRLLGPDKQLLLVRVATYSKAGRQISIAVAEDLTPIRSEVRRFQVRYIMFGLIALALLLLLQRRFLRRGLAPLRETAEELDELERGQRQQLSEQVPQEILPLVRQINQLLTTLQQRLQRSRNAMGNLAHALKTPLTLLGQMSDRDDIFRDTTKATQARELVEKIRTLTERELKRARLAGAIGSGERLRLGVEMEALVKVLRQLYRERGLEISIAIADDLGVAADREDMHELFGNLLDNACKWARSRVHVSADKVPAGLRIRIEDDGPGGAADELDKLNQRGVRIDEGEVPGHGLGLAIVQDVVSHYGGQLTLGQSSELGGFLAEVILAGDSTKSWLRNE